MDLIHCLAVLQLLEKQFRIGDSAIFHCKPTCQPLFLYLFICCATSFLITEEEIMQSRLGVEFRGRFLAYYPCGSRFNSHHCKQKYFF